MHGVATAKKKRTAGRPRHSHNHSPRAPRWERGTFQKIHDTLFATYGPQHWWPGDSRFEIMVGAVLTQNTAWTNVERAIANLKKARSLTPEAIVKVRPRQLGLWLKPSGYFNVKARRLKAMCQWLIAQGGVRKLANVPTSEMRDALLSVHGIGPETADDILLYAFDRPVFVIDAYTRRIFHRLGFIQGTEDYETLRQMFESALDTDVKLFNEYHALLVVHAKDVCRAKPLCNRCSLVAVCRLPH